MQDEFDTLIDDAIKTYADPEPSPELAINILRRAQQQQQRRASWKLALAFAAPAIAASVLMAGAFAGSLALPSAPDVVATIPPVPNVQIAQPQQLAEASDKPMRSQTARTSTARSTVRPLPVLCTKEELALIQFVQRYPKEAASIAEAQKHDMRPLSQKPIAISRLTIAPLTISALSPEK